MLKLRIPAGIRIEVHAGDSGSTLTPNDQELDRWRYAFTKANTGWAYTVFNENLGFGKGHNRLFSDQDQASDLLIVNPDVYGPPSLIECFVAASERHPDFGILEARQTPLEHPKWFHESSLETQWCSGACMFVRADAFRSVGGFDEVFFLYGEDVDLSWRIKAADRKLYYCPECWILHAKTLSRHGIEPGVAETLYSSLANLILFEKYGRGRSLREFIAILQASPDPLHAEALQRFDAIKVHIKLASASERSAASFDKVISVGARRWEYISAARARPSMPVWGAS